ncbi:TIGR02466 family protein [Pseudomonas sp. FEN]|uniref:TIGR02466 family protein n=1 Tax=Pseudomonas sp. FEN TaxID=2767468 RepID=UPI001CD28C47|nr:TIGR02466 family protein [Pseudomonas sp. FEN]
MSISPMTPEQLEQSIKITRLFSTPLASLEYPDFPALNDELRTTILQRAAETPSVVHSNEGGWQSDDDFAAWSGDAGARLIAFANTLANQLSAVNSLEHGLIEPNLQWTLSAWANVNHHGHSNALHGHPGAFWSGVYWVDDGTDETCSPVGGELEFIDPRGMLPSMLAPALRMRIGGCLDAGYSSCFVPRTGTFLMFPSWLMHAVRRYEGARARISIAFNLCG